MTERSDKSRLLVEVDPIVAREVLAASLDEEVDIDNLLYRAIALYLKVSPIVRSGGAAWVSRDDTPDLPTLDVLAFDDPDPPGGSYVRYRFPLWPWDADSGPGISHRYD